MLGFPGDASDKEPACQCRRHETWVRSLDQEDPLEEEMATHSSISCLENPHGQRSLVGYCPGGHKESDMTEQLTLSLFTVVSNRTP